MQEILNFKPLRRSLAEFYEGAMELWKYFRGFTSRSRITGSLECRWQVHKLTSYRRLMNRLTCDQRPFVQCLLPMPPPDVFLVETRSDTMQFFNGEKGYKEWGDLFWVFYEE